MHKAVFLAVFQGDQLHAKVRKICEGLVILCFFVADIVMMVFIRTAFGSSIYCRYLIQKYKNSQNTLKCCVCLQCLHCRST